MKRFIYFLLALGFFSSCNNEADMLPNKIQDPATSTTNFSALAESNLQNKSSQLADIDQQIAALDISENDFYKVSNFKNGFLNLNERIKQLNLKGNDYFSENNYHYALIYYLFSLQLAASNNDIQKEATLYRNVALAYQHKGDYRKAVINFWHSFKLWKIINDNARVAQLYNDLGVVYALASDFKGSVDDFEVENSHTLAYFEAGLDGRVVLGDMEGISQSEYNINTLYAVWSDGAIVANGRSGNDDYLYAQDDPDDDL